MTTHFDHTPDRKPTFAFKWEKYKGKDVIPAWVADTEFSCAQPILDALHSRVDHGPLGYHHPTQYQPAFDAVVRWLDKQHNWQIEPEWVVWVPGVVPGFNIACTAYCQPGDKVMVQTPNYPPLLAAPALQQMERVDIPTVEQNGRYTIDLAELEHQAADPACKLFIVCNPMNPVGSVLTAEELDTIADICQRHNVLLCSDEIHCDLVLEEGATHLPASKHPGLQDHSLTLMAASKTFNVAGLGCSFAVIPNAKLRQAFAKQITGLVPWANVLGLVATEAAFTQCDDWHQELVTYLRGNRDYLVEHINQIPGLKALKPDATYLLWIDASGLGVKDVQKWCEERGVGPSPGRDFHAPDCFRINFGCSRQMLEEIVARLQK